MGRKLVIILGPTAVGKTDYSIHAALEAGSPVISCDSRQIFKEMSIGTAVPSKAQLASVRHYFIQTNSVTQLYSAGQYETDALSLIESLFAHGHETLVMTGGSCFYIDAICNGLDDVPQGDSSLRASLMAKLSSEGVESLWPDLKRLDPETFASIELSNGQRVVRALEACIVSGKPFSSFKKGRKARRDFAIEKIGLTRPREELYSRINKRVDIMMEEGLLEEAKSLLPYREYTAMQTVGYRELFSYFDGQCSLDEAVSLIKLNTRHYAKRQMTWWRRDPSILWKTIL
ncbi:MAG: tRNA (adenosine(37)-N6)-dimethylallyltransferase MiaA [Bacteroidales bacterium]